jgi:hypothetical protein
MVSPLEVQTAVKSSTTSRREHTRQSLEIPEQSSPLTPPAQPSTDTSQDEDRSTSGGLAGRWLVTVGEDHYLIVDAVIDKLQCGRVRER